ncbi:MAG: SGNH/GDSL hydrolase family protein [Cyanobacteriota bacterium]
MRKNISNLALLAASVTICGLALLEFSYRLQAKLIIKDDRSRYAKLPLHDEEHHFCQGPKDRVVIDRDREFIERPNAEYFEYRDHGAKLHSYNEYGYRINEKRWSQRADIKKLARTVWVFGDSFTRGSLADNTETIPAVLTTLNKNNTYFINFGIGGYGYLNALKTLQWAQQNLPIKPAAILYIGHANDIADDRRTEIRLKTFAKITSLDALAQSMRKEATLPSPGMGGVWSGVLERFPWLDSRLRALAWLKPVLLHRGKTTIHSADYKRSLRNNMDFLRLAKSITPHVYAFYIPSLHPDQWPSYDKQDALNIQLLQRSTHQENVPFLDLSHGVMVGLSESFQPPIHDVADLYGRLDPHLNESGYFAVSIAIARQLERMQGMPFRYPAQPLNSTDYSVERQRCPDG